MGDSSIGLALDGHLGSLDSSAAVRQEEAELVGGLCRGDEQAYETLIDRFQQPVFNLTHRLMEDPSEVSDVVQEVFLKVFRNIGHFRGQSSLKTWIYRIAVNEAHNHRRWFSRHRRREVGLDREDADGVHQIDPVDTASSPYERVADRETMQRIEVLLTGLNPSFRTAVVLRDIEDLSYEEIAEVLNLSLGTVKSRILRGREALRRRLMDDPAARSALAWGPVAATE